MPRSIQQIKRDLATLEEVVATIAVELRNNYIKYLSLLSESVRKQLILASYQICTQTYPESFLSLSFNQRQKLQEKLRKIGKRVKTQLFQYLEESSQSVANQNLKLIEEMRRALSIQKEQEENQERQELSLQEEVAAVNHPETTEEESSQPTESTEEKAGNINNPDDLIQWHLQVEYGIDETLKNISREANRYLQRAGVLPNQLPAKILEMAIQAEESGSVVSGPPNLFNVLIQTGNDEESEGLSITITALRLRLVEIEFSDQTLSAERNQIRNLLAKIDKIKEQYQKKQRECAIAEAEAAWRSSWFED